MSKQKPAKKKVVVTTSSSSSKRPAQPKTRAKARTAAAAAKRDLTFGRETFFWMGIGVALIIIGMALMTGGHMPSSDVWEADRIYGFRRTVLAPIVILAGLGIEIYAIFKK